MEICVEYSNKDLVKKLGCKWLKNKDKDYKWICPFDNSSNNVKGLIKLQDQGIIGFKSGSQITSNCYHYKKQEGEILFWTSMGGPTGYYDRCLNEKQIYEKINTVFRLPKNENGDLFIEDDPWIEEEKKIDDKIKLLAIEKKNKYDEMIKRHEEEKKQLELYYKDEETHLNNCKFRDYEQDIRSFKN